MTVLSFISVRQTLSIYLGAALLLAVPAVTVAQRPGDWLKEHPLSRTSATVDKDSVAYFSGKAFTVEGQAFDDTATTWSRLPARYKDKVTRGVWSTGLNSAGIALRFVTDSPVIFAKWDAPRGSMNHMARTGSNGLDLYAFENGKWNYMATGKPETTGPTTARIYPRAYRNSDPDAAKPVTPREYLLFLPTYSSLNSIEIGIGPNSNISKGTNRNEGKDPIVFYGTSISQAGCAPRSGLGHIERLRRALDYPTVNLGFSGSGKCEPVMADLLAEIPAALYVIETVPNMNSEMIAERGLSFVKSLYQKHPNTPILMVESPNVPLNNVTNVEWKKVYDQAKASGINNIHYLPGDDLYGDTDNPTVDGVHPTDLGFYQMARHYEPVIREILGDQVSPQNAGGR